MRKLPELEQITAFLAVAEDLSFRRAAERLAIDQSALSRRVKDLEQRLGFQLLFRTTHSVRLTDAGRSFYESNHRILDRLGQSIDAAGRIASGSMGSLRIAYMTFAAVALLPAAVGAYRAQFPDVALIMTYERTQQQRMSLARGEIDIGLMLGPFEHSDFETMEIANERPIAVLAESDPFAAKGELMVRDVATSPLIIGNDQQWDYYRQLIGNMLAAQGFKARVAFEAPSLFGILGLVRAGLGITIVPEVMMDFCPTGLVTRPIHDADHAISTIAAWRRPAGGTVRDFTRILRAQASTARHS